MNSLQAGLIGVSVLVIALFAAWMWWQSWRNGREERMRVAQRDAASRSKIDPSQRSDPTLAYAAPPPISRDPPAHHLSEPLAVVEDDLPRESDAAISIAQIARTEPPQLDVRARETPTTVAAAAFAVEVAPATASVATVRREQPDFVSPAEAAHYAPKSAPLPTSLPLDERLHVYARLSPRDGQAIDCNAFADMGDRTLAWGRVFQLSAWEVIGDPTSGGAVQELCLGLPIASRAGPLSDGEVVGWKRAVSARVDQLGFDVEYGGDFGVGERAVELDQFLAAADVICVLYLVRKDGGHWSGTRLRGTLEANGFRLQADGRFVYFEVESESPIFSAVDGFERSFTPERLRTENVTALRLVFEASNVVNPVARFDVYRQTLRALARLLESEIKDSNGSNVGDDAFAALRAEVVAGSQALAEAGIECGSPTANSLFR